MIVAVQLSDATPRQGAHRSGQDRGVFPGDGIIPLKESIAAIRSTGYDGAWAIEWLFTCCLPFGVNPSHWTGIISYLQSPISIPVILAKSGTGGAKCRLPLPHPTRRKSFDQLSSYRGLGRPILGGTHSLGGGDQ
jgi:hypothetical protein